MDTLQLPVPSPTQRVLGHHKLTMGISRNPHGDASCGGPDWGKKRQPEENADEDTGTTAHVSLSSKIDHGTSPGGLYFFEALAILNAIAVVILILARVGWLGWNAIGATLWMGTGYSIAMVLLALVLRIGFRILSMKRVLAAFTETIRGVSPLFLLRVIVGWSLVSFGYMWLKLFIPLLRSGTSDAVLWRLDASLHGGVPPAQSLLHLLPKLGLLFPLDTYYASFLFLASLVFSWRITDEDPVLRVRFINGFALVCVLCAWLYLAVPALGPCYVYPQLFKPYWTAMPLARLTQTFLMRNYQRVLFSRSMGLIPAPFNPGAGIAAFPSLHVATWAYFLFASARDNRWAIAFFTIMTLTTLVGSVATGWHYAIDGYAGILIAALGAIIGSRIQWSIALPSRQ